MTEDIVARLRADALWFGNVPKHNKVHIDADKVPRFAAKLSEAADEIERLRAIVHNLENATDRHPQRKQEDTQDDRER